MAEEQDLIAGRFYWVIPALDPDTREEWEDGLQPARYAGKNADGHCLWNYIGIDGCRTAGRAWRSNVAAMIRA
jgi:hypothetical protein